MKNRHEAKTVVRGELRSQLQWWYHTLQNEKKMISKFWTTQPDTPLVCSDASGDDGWGCCVMGMHIVGTWPRSWRQSVATRKVSMLFKELVPPAVTTMLLAPMLDQQVLCAALDNAGTAFTINRLSCNCEMSLELLRPLTDSLSHGSFALLAGHAHREHNVHTDMLSHALPDDVWSQAISGAKVRRPHRLELHFAVLDVMTQECYLATVSFRDPLFARSTNRGAASAKP